MSLSGFLIFGYIADVLAIEGNEDAYIVGDVVKIPILSAGESQYSLDIQLIPDTNPVQLKLIAFEDITSTAPNISRASTFSGNILTIPVLASGATSYRIELLLISTDPTVILQLSKADVIDTKTDKEKATAIYTTSISSNIAQSKCVVCHVQGGIADKTSLKLERTSDISLATNIAVFEAILKSRTDGKDYILSKVSGKGHGGGAQLSVGSVDYNNLSEFLSLLSGSTSASSSVSYLQFFDQVALLSNAKTLRRASIIFAGRVPTAAEFSSVNAGDDDALRVAVKNLMNGENFHDFLKDAANDRLLVRSIGRTETWKREVLFPKWFNQAYDLALSDSNDTSFTGRSFKRESFVDQTDYGIAESPLELIAYVVENDKPFSEILTADYVMLNKVMNTYLEGTANFDDSESVSLFKPGKILGYYGNNGTHEFEDNTELDMRKITKLSDLKLELPSNGILSSFAFLARYPSTATNRNRARARWTYYHFLDTDIENSAPRTTDPVALKDKNNPTLLNENCTVCHATLDPVAGTFQYYGDAGQYKMRNGGVDSLDRFYKNPEDEEESSLYVRGDTWYRDMRIPGFDGKEAEIESLKWLVNEIVNKKEFLKASIKFWWPAIMNSPILLAPTITSDANYNERMLAFNAQNAEIERLMDSFSNSNMNTKTLFVDMVMSNWFRGKSLNSEIDPVLMKAHEIARVSSRKLLTPELLERKTASLTGYRMGRYKEFANGGLSGSALISEFDFLLDYGGIDSDGVTERASSMTSIMSSVAMRHALQAACPIVLHDFLLTDGSRKYFNGINAETNPDSNASINQIKTIIKNLYGTFHGKQYAINSTEVTDAYNLYFESWKGHETAQFEEYCDWQDDYFLFEDLLPDDVKIAYVLNKRGFPVHDPDKGPLIFVGDAVDDLTASVRAWEPVLIYMMTHYDYLYE